jgi:hypothetical protein
MGVSPTTPGASLTFLRHAGCPALRLVAANLLQSRISTEIPLRRGGVRGARKSPVRAKGRLLEPRGRGQTCQGPWGTRCRNGALRRHTFHIALPRSDAAADAKSTVRGMGTHTLIASDGPCRRSIARSNATDQAQTPVPNHLTFARPDWWKTAIKSRGIWSPRRFGAPLTLG